jgi:hypothetical protein
MMAFGSQYHARGSSGSARKVQAAGEADPALGWEEQLRSGCDLEDV